jgi:hypothetical protein
MFAHYKSMYLFLDYHSGSMFGKVTNLYYIADGLMVKIMIGHCSDLTKYDASHISICMAIKLPTNDTIGNGAPYHKQCPP